MSIEVNNISKFYGEQKALDDVSFSLQKGEIVGFLGPNGAGKSTMMKIITCYIPQSSGNVRVCNLDVIENPLEIKQKVGYLAEHNPLYYEMYVKEYLQFIAGLHSLRKSDSELRDLIDMVGLTLEKKKKIGALSKGYKQRVGLAQALIHNPEVLILDEPTTGLDPNQIEEIRMLIKKLGQEKTVMMSTHIMQEVEAVCSRALIINRGKIVADKPISEIKNQTKDKQVIVVEFAEKQEINTLQELDFIEDAEILKNGFYRLTSNQKEDIRSKIFQFAMQQGTQVLTIQREEQKLEDIFKSLTQN